VLFRFGALGTITYPLHRSERPTICASTRQAVFGTTAGTSSRSSTLLRWNLDWLYRAVGGEPPRSVDRSTLNVQDDEGQSLNVQGNSYRAHDLPKREMSQNVYKGVDRAASVDAPRLWSLPSGPQGTGDPYFFSGRLRPLGSRLIPRPSAMTMTRLQSSILAPRPLQRSRCGGEPPGHSTTFGQRSIRHMSARQARLAGARVPEGDTEPGG
jgi:hypothetical protein